MSRFWRSTVRGTRGFSKRSLAWTILSIALVLGIWGFILEPRSLRLCAYEIEVSGWPRGLDSMRIALLSDFHVGSPYNDLKKLREIVARTNAAEPDLVLLAGDYVVGWVLGGRLIQPEEIARTLASLHAPLGVYAVMGNHDVWFDGERVRRALSGARIRVLEDEAVALPTEAGELWLIGLRDGLADRPDVSAALENVPDGAEVLALTHNPDVFPEIPARVRFTLAGHTHGGQVKLPFLGTPIVPSRYGSRFVRGLAVEGDRRLFVTSGLGTTILPVRFRVAPEISLIRVRAPGASKPAG